MNGASPISFIFAPVRSSISVLGLGEIYEFTLVL